MKNICTFILLLYHKIIICGKFGKLFIMVYNNYFISYNKKNLWLINNKKKWKEIKLLNNGSYKIAYTTWIVDYII